MLKKHSYDTKGEIFSIIISSFKIMMMKEEVLTFH